METEDEFGENPTLPGSDDNHEHPELSRGTSIDRYLIVEPIGAGGMGAVYRAYDPKLNRGVALKILSVKPDEPGASEKAQIRLIREAQALAQLSHPNVVAVHDYGSFGDDVFIAMEMVEGKTLDEWLRQKKRSVKETLEVMIAAGRGLSAAHKAGLVHRDFKPGNVIVGADGRVRVLDFGLARASDEKLEEAPKEIENHFDGEEFSSDSSPNLLQSPLTKAGGVLGTPLYMAPEQHLGLKTDERTDQFGFCIVLYEALYGKRPFAARTMEELKKEVIRQRVCVPNADANVPGWLWQIISKGLSVKPEERHATIDSLLDDLDKDPEIARAKRRKKLQSAILILLLVATTLGFGYYALFKGSKVCTGAERKVAGVWSDERKEKISQAFAKTGLSYANDSFVRVERRFGEYLHRWKSEYTETCEATRLRDEQPVEIMVLKMRCLDKRLNSAGALVKVLGEADKIVVARSVQAVSSLSGFSKCNDVEALQSRIPPPKNEKTKNKVAAIRNKLAEVEAFEKTGKYREGLTLCQQLESKANVVKYKPIQAEVLFWLGNIFDKTGEYKKAEHCLYDSARLAGESKNALLAAKAMTWLVWVVGYSQSRYQEGLSIARYTEIMLGYADGEKQIRDQLLNYLGILHYSQRNYNTALEYFRKSLAIRVEHLESEAPEVASLLNNLGLSLHMQGKSEKALNNFRKSLAIFERALGVEHPQVAKPLNNIGEVLISQGKYETALDYYRRALVIDEKAKGPEHPDVAWSLSNIGNIVLNQGRPANALKPLERVADLCKKKVCNPVPYGFGLFGLARALMAIGRNKPQAITLAKQALEVFAKTPKTFKKELTQINAWLEKQNTLNQKSNSAAKR